jgi:hypothetical protein
MLRDCARKLNSTYRLRLSAIIGLAALFSLTACVKQENAELQWARAALERNPQVKVLAVDVDKNTLQVRIKATGETLTLAPGELAAIPIGELLASTNPPRQMTPVAATPTPEPATTAEPTAPEVETLTTTAEPPKPEYTVQRQDGRVIVTGPGVSIETHKSTAQDASASAPRFDEPIVCDGKRMLHLDNKRLNVDGDAITARGGCELHITNSHITATGTAVVALDATVHIINSELQGSDGSLTTSSAARVFLRTSKFTGLARRDPQSAIQDQGGNSWR